MKNKTIKDLKDILEIHKVSADNTLYIGFIMVDPKQVAEYIYNSGYRKVYYGGKKIKVVKSK